LFSFWPIIATAILEFPAIVLGQERAQKETGKKKQKYSEPYSIQHKEKPSQNDWVFIL